MSLPLLFVQDWIWSGVEWTNTTRRVATQCVCRKKQQIRLPSIYRTFLHDDDGCPAEDHAVDSTHSLPATPHVRRCARQYRTVPVLCVYICANRRRSSSWEEGQTHGLSCRCVVSCRVVLFTILMVLSIYCCDSACFCFYCVPVVVVS